MLSFIRGLTLGLTLSVLNFLGLFLTILLLGGLGEWNAAQFVGVFGALEVATGLAFIICPNVWRMPVIEAETSERTSIRLAVSTLFIPHWAGGAKAIAGTAMVAFAFYQEGASLASLSLVPFILLAALGTVTVSIAIARWGVARPEFDVIHIVMKRPNREDIALPGLSLSAAAIQIISGTFALPVLKLVEPGAFFASSFAPSPTVLTATAAAASLVTLLALVAWRDRLEWQAPREQQEKAEEPA
jgi:hypothetical protein